MLSEELKELIYLAVEPNCFDEAMRQVIYRRADSEGSNRREVDEYITELLSKKYQTQKKKRTKTLDFLEKFFLKRLHVDGERYWIDHIQCDGETIEAGRTHRYFFFGRPVSFTLPVEDIVYFDIFSKVGVRKRAEFGSKESQWDVRLKKDIAEELRQVCVNHLARFSWPDVKIYKTQRTPSHSLTQPLLWVSNDCIVRSHNCMGGTESRDIVTIKDVAFFCKTKGMVNANIYFGYCDQIDVNGVPNNLADYLENHCKEHGAKIGKEQLHEFLPVGSFFKKLNPANWFHKEKIVLNEEAIIYYNKSLFNTECTYLPYKDVKVARFGWGFFGKSINLFGIQNIITHNRYSSGDCVDVIKAELDKHGIKPGLAKVRHSWPWFRMFGADVVAMTYDGLCLSAHEYKGLGVYGRRRTYYIPYSDIYHYDKFWWMLLWRTYYIKAHPQNIRKDQLTELVQLKFRRMVFWCGLYNRLNSSSAKKDDREHKYCKEDNKHFK